MVSGSRVVVSDPCFQTYSICLAYRPYTLCYILFSEINQMEINGIACFNIKTVGLLAIQ